MNLVLLFYRINFNLIKFFKNNFHLIRIQQRQVKKTIFSKLRLVVIYFIQHFKSIQLLHLIDQNHLEVFVVGKLYLKLKIRYYHQHKKFIYFYSNMHFQHELNFFFYTKKKHTLFCTAFQSPHLQRPMSERSINRAAGIQAFFDQVFLYLRVHGTSSSSSSAYTNFNCKIKFNIQKKITSYFISVESSSTT